MNIVCVIMAGGIGARFWPKSRIKNRNNIFPFFSKKSLIEETVERLSSLVHNDGIFISTSKEIVGLIKEKVNVINDDNYIIEPHRRISEPRKSSPIFYFR